MWKAEQSPPDRIATELVGGSGSEGRGSPETGALEVGQYTCNDGGTASCDVVTWRSVVVAKAGAVVLVAGGRCGRDGGGR